MPEISDESWAEVARNSRAALALLGREITPRCLPGEPDHCGASFAQHACAHLAVLQAIADHQLGHLGGDAILMSDQIYNHEVIEITRRCGRHA